MPETIDFEKIARRLILLIDPDGAEEDGSPVDDLHPQAIANQLADIAEELRLAWNARGAADMATIETSLASQMGATASGPYLKNLDRELRKARSLS